MMMFLKALFIFSPPFSKANDMQQQFAKDDEKATRKMIRSIFSLCSIIAVDLLRGWKSRLLPKRYEKILLARGIHWVWICASRCHIDYEPKFPKTDINFSAFVAKYYFENVAFNWASTSLTSSPNGIINHSIRTQISMGAETNRITTNRNKLTRFH